MKKITTIDTNHKQWIAEFSDRYLQSQIKAAVRVNCTMFEFYWNIGMDFGQKQFLNTYGSGFLKHVSADLRRGLLDVRGCLSLEKVDSLKAKRDVRKTNVEKRDVL